MKLRITQQGFERYTGQMGVINFEDGLSTNDVRLVDAIRMSAVMICEWEDGTSPSIAQSILDNANTAAPMFEKVEVATKADVTEVATAAVSKPKFTTEELEAIADKSGIGGLRELAEKYDIKSNSIRGLIDALMKVQE